MRWTSCSCPVCCPACRDVGGINWYCGTRIPDNVKIGVAYCMEFRRQTNKRLYEEHVATLHLLARVERVFTGRAGVYPPMAGDPEWPGFARALLSALVAEVARHFAIEERGLFPR